MKIEISNLPELLSSLIGVPVQIEKFIFHEKSNRQSQYLSFESQNLTEHTGILKNHYEYFMVSSFGSNFTPDEDIYWVSVAFSFTYVTGGSNGHVLGNIFYRFSTNKWFLKV